VSLNDVNGPVALSSPVVANLAGGPAAVVGDRAGHVYAAYLGNGAEVPGWPVGTGGVPVDSPPSVAGTTVYFGVGNSATPTSGGYEAVNGNGSLRWFQTENNPSTDATRHNGVRSGMAVGTLQGQTAVTSGSMGQEQYAFNASSGAVLAGFPWFEADSNFSTPAIADIEGNGQNQIVEGGDSTAGVAYNVTYSNGGHIRILSQTGNAGQGNPSGGLYCEYNTNQAVQSSPAVGQFLGGGEVGAVVGTSSDGLFAAASQNDTLLAINKGCGLAWSDRLNGDTTSSPALADVLGNGGLQVVEGTNTGGGASGTVYALDGSTGRVIWSHGVLGAVFGSVVTADLGGGYQDVVVPTSAGVEILDGRTGAPVATVEQGVGVQASPLVTRDPNGSIGITVAGYNGANQGVIEHFEVGGSNGGLVNEAGAWPEFHHDPQLTGNAGTPPPVTQVACKAPASVPNGYDEVASDGGVFTFGNLPYCGSEGSVVLNAPVVGTAQTRDGGGYWEVASDGGIFNFGDAAFHGSEGGHHLNAPIVGMAATPDGRGYWEVASDGGIFTFGDAPFYGSEGGHHLNAPIVGMAATPDGRGYWEVATDGGIFTFGDAAFHGSEGGDHLNAPIVGMAAHAATGGYWLVASDGGIFSFQAPFYGSKGNQHLNRPIVAMAGF
jgi:outer membrane protein assembly factor BamB